MTRDEKIRGLLPHFMNTNRDKTSEEIQSYLRQMPDADLQYNYDRLAPLDPDTEAKIAAQAQLHSDLAIKRLQQNEQHENNARAKFAEMARQLGISNCDTNFRLAYDTLRPNTFNLDDISSFIADGRLSFIPASPDEQAETELIQKQAIVEPVLDNLRGHLVKRITGSDRGLPFDVFGQISYGETKEQNRQRQVDQLLELPLETLRQLHRRAQDNQAVKAGQSVERPTAPVDPNLNSGSGIDRANGSTFLPLPQKNQHGETLDAAYLVRLANQNFDLYKRLEKKHGYFNMTQRIKGLA